MLTETHERRRWGMSCRHHTQNSPRANTISASLAEAEASDPELF